MDRVSFGIAIKFRIEGKLNVRVSCSIAKQLGWNCAHRINESLIFFGRKGERFPTCARAHPPAAAAAEEVLVEQVKGWHNTAGAEVGNVIDESEEGILHWVGPIAVPHAVMAVITDTAEFGFEVLKG